MLVDPGTVAKKVDPKLVEPVLKFKKADQPAPEPANPDPPDAVEPKPVEPVEEPTNRP